MFSITISEGTVTLVLSATIADNGLTISTTCIVYRALNLTSKYQLFLRRFFLFSSFKRCAKVGFQGCHIKWGSFGLRAIKKIALTRSNFIFMPQLKNSQAGWFNSLTFFQYF